MKEEMTTFEYDVVIVGGGPSGVACGIQLQKNGISNCIIDKAVFPRKKLCGGLVTEKTCELLRELCDSDESVFSPAIRENACGVSIYVCNEKLATASPKTNLRIADRVQLDNCLLAYYKALGGKVFEGKRVLSVSLSESEILVSDGTCFRYQYLVAADGANSMIRAKTGKTLDSPGFCMETEVSAAPLFAENHEIQIHFGVIEKGYSWVFPCGNTCKIGFGNAYDKRTDYRKQFIRYLDMLGIHDENTYKIEGAFVPYGGCMTDPTCSGRVLFVGDAAGMVDPLYGEGLYYAYLSGSCAADSIVQYPNDAAKQYAGSVEPIIRQIRSCASVKRIFFSPLLQKLFKRCIKGRNRFLSFFVDYQVSRYSYPFSQFCMLFFDYKRKYKKEYADVE